MATWGGYSRDGGIARDNHNNSNNNNNNNNNNNHHLPFAYANTHTNNSNNAAAATAASTTSTTTGTGLVDHFSLRGLDVPGTRQLFPIASNAVPGSDSFSPLPSLSDNDSLFATVGDNLSSPFHTTPSTISFPLLHSGAAFNSTVGTPSRELSQANPLSFPVPFSLFLQSAPIPTATSIQTSIQTQTPTITPAPASVHPPGNFGSRIPGRPDVPSGGYSGGWHLHAPSNQQFGPQPTAQGNRPLLYPFTTPSSPFPATAPSVLPQPHISNTNIWSNPSISQAQPLPRATSATANIDDHFLTTLATQDFSSPSLPPLSYPTSPTAPSPSPRHQSKLVPAGQEMPPPSTRRRAAQRGGAVDLTKEEPEFEALSSGIDSSIPLATMPPTTRRQSLTSAEPPNRKRRPSTVTSPSGRHSKARRKEQLTDDDGGLCPFVEDDLFELPGQDAYETIDLSNATEVPAEVMAPKVDNRVKIAHFQCVICMDDTTALTVTHCGHLFCSECLHSSLHIDSMKRTCPVCRTKVELKDKNKKAVKSYFHLELKVMTATKKGKRPAE